MATACGVDTAARELLCRNGKVATHLKLVSIGVIFFTSVFGFSSPAFLARLLRRSGDPATYDRAILLIKCFAAGVILSTSLVHVMPDAFAALADCHVASSHPWKDYPFSGLGTLVGAVLALLVDLTASSHAELHNHSVEAHVSGGKGKGNYEPIGMDRSNSGSIKKEVKNSGWGEGKLGEVKEYYRVGKKDNDQQREEDAEEEMRLEEAVVLGVEKVEVESEEELERRKQRMVSKVLEIGIIFHSVIIGVTMGMSQNQCTIRPLVAALAFHQIFEGMGLGGCIAQAGFGFITTAYMCFMFAATTPLGIILGMIIFSLTGYDDTNANALILEGLLGSLSSGILIYMALVNLISADFFHNKMMGSGETSMKKTCYIALILGSASMSLLALWA